MPLRNIQVVLSLIGSLTMVGFNEAGNHQVVPSSDNASTAAPLQAESPQLLMQPLTADQLAQILGLNVWTAKYSGGPLECWLEIEEEGQTTMPKRMPVKDFIGAGSVNPASEGSIVFWWSRREDRQGGELTIKTSNAGYSYGLNKDAFTFAWPSFTANHTPTGSGQVLKEVPGKEFVIVNYDAQESLGVGDNKTPRRVHLKLIGRFSAQSK